MTFSRNAHLKIAGIIWGAVGGGLFLAGFFILFRNRIVFPEGPPRMEIIQSISTAVGLALGWIKGRWVLVRVGRRNRTRIEALPAASPFYATFSLRSWILVLAMIVLGRVIRLAGAPFYIVGGLYIAVGTALLIGSLVYFDK